MILKQISIKVTCVSVFICICAFVGETNSGYDTDKQTHTDWGQRQQRFSSPLPFILRNVHRKIFFIFLPSLLLNAFFKFAMASLGILLLVYFIVQQLDFFDISLQEHRCKIKFFAFFFLSCFFIFSFFYFSHSLFIFCFLHLN